jgi:murein L,D-transpeptidase YafK
MNIRFYILLTLLIGITSKGFAQYEIPYNGDRVALAKRDKDAVLRRMCEANGISFPPKQVFIRSFKRERTLEMWARLDNENKYILLKTYKNCQLSGILGPKREEGDMQVPEGFYYINEFNPNSDYFLSLGINYPNKSDQIRSYATDKGGDIYIHGHCSSIGCIPITDDGIKEVYLLCLYASNNGQTMIPVHIFPFKLTFENMRRSKREYADRKDLTRFWENDLFPGYRKFEVHKRPPEIQINDDGSYYWEFY